MYDSSTLKCRRGTNHPFFGRFENKKLKEKADGHRTAFWTLCALALLSFQVLPLALWKLLLLSVPLLRGNHVHFLSFHYALQGQEASPLCTHTYNSAEFSCCAVHSTICSVSLSFL